MATLAKFIEHKYVISGQFMQLSYQQFWAIIKLHWRPLIWAGLAGLLTGYLVLLCTTPQYTASMVVGPISLRGATAVGTPLPDQSGNGFRQIGSGAELSDYTRYLQLLTTPNVMAGLQDKVPNLLPTLFSREWDQTHSQWQPPRGFTATLRRFLNWSLRRPGWRAPDTERLSGYLAKEVKISMVTLPGTPTPMRRITYRNADRGLAIGILYGLHQSAEGLLREEADRRSQAVIEYIQMEMGKIGLQEHRAALVQLLAEQERVRMMISLNLPYAADIITPPTAPLQPDYPQPWPIILGGMIMGVFIRLALIMRQYLAASIFSGT